MTMSNNQRRKLKSASRFFAVQALFQMELSGQTVEAVTKEFIDFRFAEEFDDVEMQDGDPGMFRALVDGAVNNQAKIDQMTDRAIVAMKSPEQYLNPSRLCRTRRSTKRRTNPAAAACARP